MITKQFTIGHGHGEIAWEQGIRFAKGMPVRENKIPIISLRKNMAQAGQGVEWQVGNGYSWAGGALRL